MDVENLNARFGRRKPFMLAGVILSLIGMILFANPIPISHLFGAEGDRNKTAIAIAVVSLWLMNIGLNITQGPSWYDECFVNFSKGAGIGLNAL